MTVEEFNKLSLSDASAALMKCCSGHRWLSSMMSHRPFASKEEMLNLSDEYWSGARYRDVMAAFAGHPKIGDKKELAKKFASTAAWADKEQAGVDSASRAVIEQLAKQNEAYEEKFGYIFIVCATGKSAKEMLDILEDRLQNHPVKEYDIAKAEQRKITKLRLEKLLS